MKILKDLTSLVIATGLALAPAIGHTQQNVIREGRVLAETDEDVVELINLVNSSPDTGVTCCHKTIVLDNKRYTIHFVDRNNNHTPGLEDGLEISVYSDDSSFPETSFYDTGLDGFLYNPITGSSLEDAVIKDYPKYSGNAKADAKTNGVNMQEMRNFQHAQYKSVVTKLRDYLKGYKTE